MATNSSTVTPSGSASGSKSDLSSILTIDGIDLYFILIFIVFLGNVRNTDFQRRGGEKYNKRRPIEGWEISHKEVILKDQIGNGSFGTVYKAHYFGSFYFYKKYCFKLFLRSCGCKKT